MDPLTISALVSGGLELGKGVVGAIQGFGAKKKIKEQWKDRPAYTRPKEVEEMLDIYRKEAGRSQLPGQDLIEAKLGRATGRSIRQAERFAPSSTAALGAISDVYGREQDAIRDLGIQFAQYKAAQQGQLAAGLGQAAQYSDQEFYLNKMQPWEQKMNELWSQKQAGFGNMWSGTTGAAGTFMDYAGTRAYTDAMSGMLSPQSGTAAPTGYSYNPEGQLQKKTKWGTATYNE